MEDEKKDKKKKSHKKKRKNSSSDSDWKNKLNKNGCLYKFIVAKFENYI